jgi:hypothetical protein
MQSASQEAPPESGQSLPYPLYTTAMSTPAEEQPEAEEEQAAETEAESGTGAEPDAAAQDEEEVEEATGGEEGSTDEESENGEGEEGPAEEDEAAGESEEGPAEEDEAAGEGEEVPAEEDEAARESGAGETPPSGAAPGEGVPAGAGDGTAKEGRHDGIDPESQANMLSYLMDLTKNLPEDKRKSFAESDVPLRIAAIRSRLLGREGLHRDVSHYDMGRRGEAAPVTTKRLADTFSYVSQMANYHPDANIGSALKQRVRRILSRLEEYRTGAKSGRSQSPSG